MVRDLIHFNRAVFLIDYRSGSLVQAMANQLIQVRAAPIQGPQRRRLTCVSYNLQAITAGYTGLTTQLLRAGDPTPICGLMCPVTRHLNYSLLPGSNPSLVNKYSYSHRGIIKPYKSVLSFVSRCSSN
jgi:hypothetical protein